MFKILVIIQSSYNKELLFFKQFHLFNDLNDLSYIQYIIYLFNLKQKVRILKKKRIIYIISLNHNFDYLNCQTNYNIILKQSIFQLNNIKCSDECQTCEQNYDNCTQCKFYNSTSQECIICVQEYGFLQIDNQCFSICGDGIKTFQEHCDDGNQINGDGCDQYCFVEDGHICDFECQQINYIEIQLQENKFDTIYDSKRSISLKFNQDVRIDTNTSITKLILVTSTTPNLQLTLLSISDSSKIINDYYNIELNLNIELKSSAKSPSIQITIKNSTLFTNHQGYSFKQNSATIYLIDFVQQDEIVIEITQNLIQINSYFLYIFLGLAILALLFGGLDIFWNLLDTLQLICYLKYFNVTYPYNLNHYFMIFGFAEFDFIKSYFNFEYLITEYVDTPQADPKFYLEGYSTVFLVNFISVVIVFLTTFLTFITMKMTSLLLHNIIKDFSEDRILLERNQINIFTFLFYKFTNSCQKYCLQVSNNFKRALIRTFMASAYDFNLAIFLQFKDLNFENPILRISSLCAIMAFLYEIYFIYSCLQLANKNNSSLQQNTIKQHYEPIFEGLDLDKNQFNFYFNILNIVKKAIFMAFLVFLYDAPCIQISLVSLLSLLQALFLLLNRCLEDQNELIKQISCESILWLSAILILMYGFNEESQILNSANITNIGWSIIGFLSLLIFIQLIIDIKQHFLFLDEKYKLLKHLRLWYLYYFQSHIYQSSLNTEQSQFQVVNNKKSKKQSRVQKVQTLENQPNQRIIISFSIS